LTLTPSANEQHKPLSLASLSNHCLSGELANSLLSRAGDWFEKNTAMHNVEIAKPQYRAIPDLRYFSLTLELDLAAVSSRDSEQTRPLNGTAYFRRQPLFCANRSLDP
jgi:hypothetical protein